MANKWKKIYLVALRKRPKDGMTIISNDDQQFYEKESDAQELLQALISENHFTEDELEIVQLWKQKTSK